MVKLKKLNLTLPNEDINSKKKLLLYSGGIDSAYILFKMIEDGFTNIEIAHINPFYINKTKLKYEKIAIDKMMEWIKTNHTDVKIKFHSYNITHEIKEYGYVDNPIHSSLYGYSQPIAWLFNILVLCGSEEVELFFGYNKDDDMLKLYSEFTELTELLNKFIKTNLTIRMPLINTEKQQIINHMISANLINKTFWCEQPKENGDVCNICDCCKSFNLNIITTMNDVILSNDVRQFSKNYLTDMVNKSEIKKEY